MSKLSNAVGNLRSQVSGKMALMMGLTALIVLVMGGRMIFLFFGEDDAPETRAPKEANLPSLADLEGLGDDGSANLSGLPDIATAPPSITSVVAEDPVGVQEIEEEERVIAEQEDAVTEAEESDANKVYLARLERMVPIAAKESPAMRPPSTETPLDEFRPTLPQGGDAPAPPPQQQPQRTAKELPPGVSADSDLFAQEPNQHFDPAGIRPPSSNVQLTLDGLAAFKTAYQARVSAAIAANQQVGSLSIQSFGPPAGLSPPSDGLDGRSLPPGTRALYRGLPGDVIFGYLDSDVNSERLHQVVARVGDGGPLDGAVLVGEPSMLGEKRIVINFSTMHFRGQEIPLNAVAVDPQTLEVALADSVNSHFVQRYGSLALASLMRGYAESLRTETIVHSQTGSAVYSGIGSPVEVQSPSMGGEDDEPPSGGTPAPLLVTRSEPTLEERLITAGGEMADVFIPTLRENLSKPPTVKVFAESGIGIKLLSPLVVPDL